MTGMGNLFIMPDKSTERAQTWERLCPMPVHIIQYRFYVREVFIELHDINKPFVITLNYTKFV